MRLFFTLLLSFVYFAGNSQYQNRQATLTNQNDDIIQGTDFTEKKKVNKVLFGPGFFGSSWRVEEENLYVVGLSTQFLMPKRFHNTFVLIGLGIGAETSPVAVSRIQIGGYGDRYSGTRAVQAKTIHGSFNHDGAA